MMSQLALLTKVLRDELDHLQKIFNKNKEKEVIRDRHYFQFVQTNTTHLFQLMIDWQDKATSLIEDGKLSVYKAQIEATKENYDMIILHSYYGDVRRRRYAEMVRSCIYVFDLVLKGIDDN